MGKFSRATKVWDASTGCRQIHIDLQISKSGLLGLFGAKGVVQSIFLIFPIIAPSPCLSGTLALPLIPLCAHRGGPGRQRGTRSLPGDDYVSSTVYHRAIPQHSPQRHGEIYGVVRVAMQQVVRGQ